MASDNSKKGRVRISKNVLLHTTRKNSKKIITISFSSALERFAAI